MPGAAALAEPATGARARRAQRVAAAQALQDSGLDWAALDACPPWLAQPAEAREALCARAGAWWLAAPLRACIDGKRLARVCDLLGQTELAALRESPGALRADALNQAPRSLLPPADDLPRHLLTCGRALLAWSLPDGLRAPVLAHLAWPDDARHRAALDEHAGWARHALHAALTSPAPTDSAPTHSVTEDDIPQSDPIDD